MGNETTTCCQNLKFLLGKRQTGILIRPKSKHRSLVSIMLFFTNLSLLLSPIFNILANVVTN